MSPTTNSPVQVARQSPARPQKKPKTVTFTGCWTCRSRKVKCDERQKNGCGVCEKSGLECAGYGVNLCWVTGKIQKFQGFRRRQIGLGKRNPIEMKAQLIASTDQPCSPSIPEDEINRMLSKVDTIFTAARTVRVGPFAVFSKGEQSCYGPVAPRSPQGITVRDREPPEQDDSTNPEYAIPQDDSFVLSSTSLETNDVPQWNPLGSKSSLCQNAFSIFPSPHLEISMPFFKSRKISMLMYHYKNHVADLLQPIFHPQNPWRTTYLPYALEGCPDLFLVQNDGPASAVSISLFHSLLSSAAFHLRNLQGGSAYYHTLGLQHRTKSLQALHAALTIPRDSQQNTVYLTAMLSLVTIDTMTGEDSDFPIHLKGCHQLQIPKSNPGTSRDSNHQVNTICNFLSLLSRTTVHEIEPRPWPIDSQLFETCCFDRNDRSVEYMYGITPTLGNLLQKVCQVAECLAFYQGKHVPSLLQDACIALKDQISLWDIESESFYLLRSEDRTMFEIVRCQARAFHSAVVIFYYRTIENYSSASMQECVKVVWENLTLAENLKDEYMDGEKRAAPMSWPAFIAACEATDRVRWVEWWERVQGYSMGNYKRQRKVILEIWAIMDADPNVYSWRDALKQSGKMVLPI
ncbi:hypothetical protein N7508_006818 [Penicillium antarcticum]|uniref:uncharacterized protein n=1 Tax=Penicillium antarcticum TaxID=416450 RepID=UPI00239B449F|nr:uncharacterized protein N7508_006818 [Penicillium antarcticum]KAJ5301955.1 hypothetical protein N7508_006818 [Penicillium antarcticum]